MDPMELNSQQTLAAGWEDGHVLVLAGAGTGKTRTIIARAAHLIKTGTAPERILLLTFTRRAAREMVDRLYRLVGTDNRLLAAGTFHHFCLYTMRRMPSAFGIESATVIDRDDQIQLMRLVRGDFRKKGEPLPQASELVRLCSYARNTVKPVAGYLADHTDYDDEEIDKIVRMAQAFDERKRRNNYLDYDDILFRFAKVLHEDAGVRERLRGFYDHLLVDEMQDTNPLQWMILDALRDPARLFCVGDDAQSIYAFRGADFRNVHSFTERVPGSRVLRLEENYRSTQGILDLANWLLSESRLAYGKHLRAHRKAVSRPKLLDFETDFDEARWVVEDLVERHEAGAPWRDHMLITRTGYGGRAVESFLVEKKVPYRFVGGIGLLQAAHVKDLLALVRAALSHRDELSWARYLTLWPRIGDATAARLIARMKDCDDPAAALGVLEKSLKGRREIPDGVRLVLSRLETPPDAIQSAGRLLEPMMKMRYSNWKVRRRDFELLVRLAEKHRSLQAFIETYTLDPISTTESERLGEDDVVTLTTAHSAKGTEARVCYLIRVEPGMYPHLRSLGDSQQEEEERRILYVAMTRAQDELIITRTFGKGAGLRMPYSAVARHSAGGSPYFLQKIAPGLVEADTVRVQPDYFTDYDTIAPWRRN
jgi:DNA helicase-2/ATP-dependent DNA helicase PcrA